MNCEVALGIEAAVDRLEHDPEVWVDVLHANTADQDRRVFCVGAAPTPPPYSPDLERAWLPDRDDIAHAIRQLAGS